MKTKKVNGKSLRRPGGPLSKNQESRKALLRGLEILSQRCDQLDRNFGLMARNQQLAWNNQKECAKSETLLDEQFAVLTRLTITSLNKVLPDGSKILYEDVNKLFMDWADFRKRKDFRDYMKEWFMGEDLSKLPPPPVEEPKKPADQPKEGGSDGQVSPAEASSRPEQPESPGPSQEAPVPEVRGHDDPQAPEGR